MTNAILATVLLFVLAPCSTDAETLRLEQAMNLARERAPEVTAAQARHRAQTARVDLARAQRRPQIRLSEVWLRTDSPSEVFGLQLNQERFSFPDFIASDPNHPAALSTATTRLEIELPVYTGGEVSTRIQQAKLQASAADETVRRQGDEAALHAAEAFVQLAQAREQIALLERSLKSVEAHRTLARALVEQGVLVRSELLRAEVEQSRVADLLAAAREQATVAKAALSFRLSWDLDTDWTLAPLSEPAPLGPSPNHWLQTAGERADLVAARQHQRAAALEVDARKALRRPRIGVRARYDLVDDHLFGSHGQNGAVMAVATLDVFASGRHRAARLAASHAAEAANTDLERFAETIRLEIRQAYARARSALDRLATARSALSAAAETERIVTERFRQGLLKTIDVLDAAAARREAETRELVARSEAHLARLRLAVAAGRSPESAME